MYKSHQNLNNHLGVPLSLLQIKQSDAVAVLELGISEPGEMEVLGRIAQPSISILTNIGEAHLEFLNSRQGIATEKGQLFNFTDPQHYILLNKDDDFTAQFAAQYRGQTYTYSTTQPAHIYATHITYSESGTFFQVHVQGQSAQMFMPMFGEYNVANVLPGIYIALQHGMTLEQVAEQLLSLKVSDMRFETVPGPQGCVLINDAYNASPSSMKKALSTLQHLYPKRQKVAVLGDMFELGDHADSFHRDIGTSLRDVPITVITIGEKARLISEACTGQHATSREQVVHMLAPYLNKEHVILFKASRSAALEEIITLITQQTA